jgi:hypothetical protein
MFRAGAPAAERTIDVAADMAASTVQIMLPGATDLRRAVCGDSVAAAGDAMLYGVVSDSVRRSLGSVRLVMSWSRDATTMNAGPEPPGNAEEHELDIDEVGRWRLCGVPRDRALSLRLRAFGLGDAVLSVPAPLTEPAVELSLSDSTVRTLFAANRAGVSNHETIFRGRVTQLGDTTLAVSGADVEILATGLMATTNGDGRFQFYGGAPPGSYEVRIRRIGYLPATERVVLVAGRLVERTVALHRLPTTLTTVVIQGRRITVPPGFEDVYARGAGAFVDFFTREDIERLGTSETSSILYQVPGVHLFADSIVFTRCQRPPPLGLRPAPAANVQVYLDGTRMTHGTSMGELVQVLHEIPPFTIQAMEVYRGVARIPAEFLADACAVIAIWTKK